MSPFHDIDAQPAVTSRPNWRRAWRALQVMRANPERTDQVFEMNVALDGGDSQLKGVLSVIRHGRDALAAHVTALGHLAFLLA